MSTDQRREGRLLRLGGLASGADSAAAGGVAFCAYCVGADERARARRRALERACRLHHRAAPRDELKTGLLVAQRAGVALEDLARLLQALEALPTDDAFEVLRGGRVQDLGEVLDRLLADNEAFRRSVHLPSAEDTGDLPSAAALALQRLTELLVRRWHSQVENCAAAWRLATAIAKAARHGAPMVVDRLITEAPGAGRLGEGSQHPPGRWVLMVATDVDHVAAHQHTQYVPADLSQPTLRRVRQAALEGIALTRHLGNAHAHRLSSAARYSVPNEALRMLAADQRRALREARIG